jgi:hypothetical protein
MRELARARDILKPCGRQRTDSTYVLAAIRVLNWLDWSAKLCVPLWKPSL